MTYFSITSNRLRLIPLFLGALCVFCSEISGQEFRTVANGVEYAVVTRDIGGSKVNMNLLRLDLTMVRIDVVHAIDAAIGTEKTSSIATRHGAFAAINGGYFRMDDSIWAGDPAGALKVDHKLLSESRDARIVIAIVNGPRRTEVEFGHPTTESYAGDDRFMDIVADGINRQRNKNELIIYTPEFGRSTLTDPGGVEMIVRKGRVTAISRQGSNLIPPDGFVLSGNGKGADGLLNRWKLGSHLHQVTGYSAPPHSRKDTDFFLFYSEDMTNGVPQLIKDGKIDITWELEKTNKTFVETKHPRTAVAKLKDGKFLMITVDGRTESSGGISLTDLAAYLLELGATDAMNLDGGGSTTMFLDGKVVNHPSDKEGERKVGDAILVTLRKK